jgi:hypothetical protein
MPDNNKDVKKEEKKEEDVEVRPVPPTRATGWGGQSIRKTKPRGMFNS